MARCTRDGPGSLLLFLMPSISLPNFPDLDDNLYGHLITSGEKRWSPLDYDCYSENIFLLSPPNTK